MVSSLPAHQRVTHTVSPLAQIEEGQSSIMQETVFYPKYLIRHSLDVLSLGISLAIALVFAFFRSGPSLSNIIGVGTLIIFILSFSRLYIRQITFFDAYFVVHRYVWPPLRFDYSEIIDMGASKIKT